MENLAALVFKKLKEAFSWLKLRIKNFFQNLSEEINNSLSHARRFFDNFTENFKEALIKSKSIIDATIEEVTNVVASMAKLFCRSVRKLNFSLLKNLFSSLVNKWQKLSVHVKDFVNLMTEAEKRTGWRFKKNIGAETLVKELFKKENVERFLEELVKRVIDSFLKNNFKSLAECEGIRAILANICLKALKELLLSFV